MAVIFVFGPCWNNLETLKNTLENNKRMISNIKKIYITTNDNNVLNYSYDSLSNTSLFQVPTFLIVNNYQTDFSLSR
jgi:hypothetical protein